MNYAHFEDLNFSGRIIFLDVDGTLLPDGGLDFDPAVIRQLEKLKRDNRVFLCTNSNDRIRTGEIEKTLGLPVATYNYKKPSSKIIRGLGIEKGNKNLSVIGDKILIDGLFALNIGARFIKVKRKISGQESVIIRLINLSDDIVWQAMKLLKLI